MKKFFCFFVVLVLCCSCGTDCDEIPWGWNEEISPDGGIAIWHPLIRNTRLIPVINAISVSFYNSDNERVKIETLVNLSSYSVEGEWYKVETSINKIQITLQSNDTEYKRQICVSCDDCGARGGITVSVFQKSMGLYE